MQQRTLIMILALAALALAAPGSRALAQDADTSAATRTEASQHAPKDRKMRMRARRAGMRMHGRHMMPVTVTAVDKTSGAIEVRNARGMDLKLHFPPDSLADVERGETITLFLGFREGDVTAEREARRAEHEAARKARQQEGAAARDDPR